MATNRLEIPKDCRTLYIRDLASQILTPCISWTDFERNILYNPILLQVSRSTAELKISADRTQLCPVLPNRVFNFLIKLAAGNCQIRRSHVQSRWGSFLYLIVNLVPKSSFLIFGLYCVLRDVFLATRCWYPETHEVQGLFYQDTATALTWMGSTFLRTFLFLHSGEGFLPSRRDSKTGNLFL